MTDPVIAGYRGRVASVAALVDAVEAARAGREADVQVVRADRVWDAAHVARAAALAARAVAEGRARAQTVSLEFVRYASGEPQIGKALLRLGITPGEDLPLVCVGFGREAADAVAALAAALGWTPFPECLQGDKGREALLALGVDPALADAFPPARWGELVLERVALTDLPR